MWFEAEVAQRRVADRPGVRGALAERRESYRARSLVRPSRARRDRHQRGRAARPLRHAIRRASAWLRTRWCEAWSCRRARPRTRPWRRSRPARRGIRCATGFVGNERDLASCRQTVSDRRRRARLGAGRQPRGAGARPGVRARRVCTWASSASIQLVERNAARIRPFEEARTFVARDLAGRQAEDHPRREDGGRPQGARRDRQRSALSSLTLEP